MQPHYNSDSALKRVKKVFGSVEQVEQAQKRIASLPSLKEIPVKFVRADATSELVDKFGLDTFDTVVDSFSLCTMGNEGAKRCLNQVSQVVKSKVNGGQVLLLENSRSSNPLLGMYQDATATSAAEMGGKGCIYNQNVESTNCCATHDFVPLKTHPAFSARMFKTSSSSSDKPIGNHFRVLTVRCQKINFEMS